MLRSLRALALVAPSFISSSFGWGTEDDKYLVDAKLVHEDLQLIYTIWSSKFGDLVQQSGWPSIRTHCLRSHDEFRPFFDSQWYSKNFSEMIPHIDDTGGGVEKLVHGIYALAEMKDDATKRSDVELRRLQRSVFKDVDLQKLWSKTQVVVAELNFLISAPDFRTSISANFGLVADSNFEIPKKDLDVGKQWVGIALAISCF